MLDWNDLRTFLAVHRLLPRAERMEQEALALQRAIVGADQRVAGTVRISVIIGREG